MSTAALLPPLLLLLSLCAAVAPPSAAARALLATGEGALPSLTSDVHEVLPLYGLPKGLLPSSVTSYSMTGNGEFVVELAAPCYVKFTDLTYYDRVIKGKLSYGTISGISGIQVKKLFAWLPITGIVADPDGKAIEFQVGFLSEKLPTSLFAEIPTCRNKAAAPCHHGDRVAAAVEAA